VDGARGRDPSSSGRKQPAKRSRRPVSAPKVHARIIAVANQKGGVGKSTTAVSLGAALAEIGKRVLVVDLDPQGNASTGLGIRHEAREVTVYDVLAAEAPIEGAIVATPVENLFAIPSTIDLAGAEIELVSQFSRELRLRRALDPLRDDEFDFILLDCPPSLGLLTVNALAAAEELIVPIQCEYYALEGLGQLLRNVRLVQQNVNQQLRLTGIVMTMFDPRTKLSEQVVDEVRRYFGDRVYETIIPRTVRLSEAPGFGQPITVYDPKSRGAQRYRALAQEVVAKLPDEGPLPVIDDLPRVVLPPREPEPGRAPRPLVSDDDDLEEMVEAPSEESAPERGDEPVPQVEATAEVKVNETPPSNPPRRPETIDTAEEPQVEASGPAGEPAEEEARPGEPEPVVESEVELDSSGSRPATEARAEPGGGSEPGLEGGGVVVTEEETQVHPSEASEAPQPETQDAPKKRWSLFRRGGDR
jgi:chromosome partitioning protein